MNKILIFSILAVILLSVSFTSISALSPENEQKLNDKIKSLEKKIKDLFAENTKLKNDIVNLKTENTKLKIKNVKLEDENNRLKLGKEEYKKLEIKFQKLYIDYLELVKKVDNELTARQPKDVESASLVSVKSDYFQNDDNILILLLFSNDKGDFVKTDGSFHLSIVKEQNILDPMDDSFDGNYNIISKEYTFSKDDFTTWQNNFGAKQTGYLLKIEKYLSNGDYSVTVSSLKLSSGTTWKTMKSSMYSSEDWQ